MMLIIANDFFFQINAFLNPMMARTKQTTRKRHLPVDQVSHDTTKPEVKRVYDEWASGYEHVCSDIVFFVVNVLVL